MSKRVFKKLVPTLEDIDGAILLINAFDPQLPTIKLFQEAIEDIPHFIVINKVDAVSVTHAQEIIDQTEEDALLASMIERRGIGGIKERLSQLPKGKIAVLGIFNSGKTSLINELTGESNKISDMPGTTLEFSEHSYKDWILLDSVGQIIDVSKPMMISYDFSGCETLGDKLIHCLDEDEWAIRNSKNGTIASLQEALLLIKERVEAGNKIAVTGCGASALVAMEMEGQGKETGLPISCFTNVLATSQGLSFSKGAFEDEWGMAEHTVQHLSPGDILIGISASGGTAMVHEAMFMARRKGVHTIAITENADTPLGKSADIIIKSNAKPEGPSSTKIQTAHLAIGHALIVTLADERKITAQQSIDFMMPKKLYNKKMGIK